MALNGTPINTGDFARDLEALSGKWVDQGYLRRPEEWRALFNVINQKRAYFEDQMYSTFGMPVSKDEGDAIAYTKASQRWGKRHTAQPYALGVQITHEMIEDGVAMDYAQMSLEALGAGLSDLKNYTAFDIFNNAFSASYANGGDAKELCATDHPTDAGTTSNELATPAALSVSSLKQAYIEMKSMTDLAGNPIRPLPQSVLIPRDLFADAEIIGKSVGLPGSADNDVNYIKSSGLISGGFKISDWLSSATAYFIMTSANRNGLKFFEHTPKLVYRDRDFDTMNAKIMVYSRFEAGWTDYNGVFGSAGT